MPKLENIWRKFDKIHIYFHFDNKISYSTKGSSALLSVCAIIRCAGAAAVW